MSNQKGFTLLEVLVVTVIGLGILLAFTQLYLSGQGTYLQTTTQLQCQRDATLIGEQFERDVAKAHSATVGGGPPTQTLTVRDNNGATTAFYQVTGGHFNGGPQGTSTIAFSQVQALSFVPANGTVTSGQISMHLVLVDKYNQTVPVDYTVVMRN